MALSVAASLVGLALASEWHAATEVVIYADERETTDLPITTAVLDTSSQTLWGLQTQCEGSPSEPSVLKMEVDASQQYTLSHVKMLSTSWLRPKLYHCSNWQFQAHFDQVTKKLVFFGGISELESSDSTEGTRVKFSNELWGLDTGRGDWTTIPSVGTRPPGRTLHGAAWDQQGRRMWIFAGFGGDGTGTSRSSRKGLTDLWQGKFDSDNSVSWDKLKKHPSLADYASEATVHHFSGQDAFYSLVWDPQREALWTMLKLDNLEFWCYVTQQRYWRKFDMGRLSNGRPHPSALVWHGKAKEILLLNATDSWIFSPSTSSFRAPTVITARNLPSPLGSGRYVWNEPAQEALFLNTDSGRPGAADMYKLRLYPSCEHIFCPQGYLKMTDSQGHSVADCCSTPCSSFSCPAGYEHVSESAWVAGQTKERCCRGEGTTQEKGRFVDGVYVQDKEDDETSDSDTEGSDQNFLWLAVVAIVLCLPLLCLSVFLLRRKFEFSFKRRTPAQQDVTPAQQDVAMDSSA